MKKLLPLIMVLFTGLFQSCEKEKYSIENDVIRTLTINETTHTFMNNDDTPYVENTLISQQDKHVYKLAMTKGVQYRILATQPNTLILQAKLTLVNIKQDTLSESINESSSKSVIVISSPETANYYLIVSLNKRTNPAFNYRLYFEEIVDDAISFSGLNWNANGRWNVSSSNSIELTNNGSNIYRHLKLVSSVPGDPNVSFVVQNSTTTNINFGLILSASDDYLQFSEWAYELTGSGYAFIAFKSNLNYTVMQLNTGSISFDWNTLEAINMDFQAGLKVELKYYSGQYSIYLNNTYLTSINGNLHNLNLLVQDSGEGKTIIKDFQIIN
jgi:hypothetical protein